mmetsp:Transcript_29467/g.84731  ORF Transcript_29467/g.84731 Transcript_29467/m.84731 type:complete len:298 (-) Transcript_29467:400-1293(-)
MQRRRIRLALGRHGACARCSSPRLPPKQKALGDNEFGVHDGISHRAGSMAQRGRGKKPRAEVPVARMVHDVAQAPAERQALFHQLLRPRRLHELHRFRVLEPALCGELLAESLCGARLNVAVADADEAAAPGAHAMAIHRLFEGHLHGAALPFRLAVQPSRRWLWGQLAGIADIERGGRLCCVRHVGRHGLLHPRPLCKRHDGDIPTCCRLQQQSEHSARRFLERSPNILGPLRSLAFVRPGIEAIPGSALEPRRGKKRVVPIEEDNRWQHRVAHRRAERHASAALERPGVDGWSID